MEELLLNVYLKYIKDEKLTFWPKLLRYPWYIIFALVGVALFAVVGEITLFVCDAQWVAWIFIMAELICCILGCIFIDRYRINGSVLLYADYVKHCNSLENLLKTYSFSSGEEIKNLYDRIEKRVSALNTAQEKKVQRVERWLQTLIFPPIIAIVAAIIGRDDASAEIIGYTIGMAGSCVVFYLLLMGLSRLADFPEKRRIAQYECFMSDLQGILDCSKSK